MSIVTEEPAEKPTLLKDYEKYLEDLGNAKSNVSLSMLAKMIESLADVIETSIEEKKSFYDADLGKTITEALTKVSESLKTLAPQKIDLSPIVKANENFLSAHQALSELMAQMRDQNQQLIEAIKTPPPVQEAKTLDDAYLDMVMRQNDVMGRANEYLSKAASVTDYSKELITIAEGLKRPGEWEFTIQRNPGGRIDKIIATAK